MQRQQGVPDTLRIGHSLRGTGDVRWGTLKWSRKRPWFPGKSFDEFTTRVPLMYIILYTPILLYITIYNILSIQFYSTLNHRHSFYDIKQYISPSIWFWRCSPSHHRDHPGNQALLVHQNHCVEGKSLKIYK